jgi:hypothetical protein
LDAGGHLVELLAMLARVVGAKQQLTAAAQLYTEIGLGAAAVAPIHGS